MSIDGGEQPEKTASVLVKGYHGTTAETVGRILAQGFRASRNDYDWLGDGVYFFQDAPLRAADWAKAHHAPERPAVVGAEISLDDCLDLLDIGWSSILAEAYDGFLRLCRQTAQPIPRQTGGAHRLDRYVLNYAAAVLAESGIAVRSIRAAFSEGTPVFPNSALFDRSHVQIAVRDLGVIQRAWSHYPGSHEP